MENKITFKTWVSVFFGGIWQFIRNIFSWKNKTPFWRVIWSVVALVLAACGGGGKAQGEAGPAGTPDCEEPHGAEETWVDTVMYAKGHAFGFRGDVTMWGGWYFDDVCVGNDQMLRYDSVGPSTLRLSLVTRDLTVDLGEAEALGKIRDFLNPPEGFRRFSKRYELCLDSVWDADFGLIKYMGFVGFTGEHADTDTKNADKINGFVCRLAEVSEIESAQVTELSAFYAGFSTSRLYRPTYSGSPHDMAALAEYFAGRTFEDWRRRGEFEIGSSEETLAIRVNVANTSYVTFSKYEYSRQGIGHGMYTETFHTLDLNSGKRLTNTDIFSPGTAEKVKTALFETMANDPHYREWHEGIESAADVAATIEIWQEPNPGLEGTEWEEPESSGAFRLPAGALTPSGVIFSFQPYEIDCWAAGAYHFIVPYDRLLPYLTPKVKQIIGAKK